MASFNLTIEASVAVAAGNNPILDIYVGGSLVTSSTAITAVTGVGTDVLSFTLNFDDSTFDYPSSLSIGFNPSSGDVTDLVTIDAARINGQSLNLATDLTGVLLAQGASASLNSIASHAYQFGRADPALSDFGSTTLTGTGGELYGTNGSDVINGSAVSDRLIGLNNDDAISGGAGDDTLYGQDGNDALLGGAGNDKLFGGAGDDMLHGQANNDTLFGEDGNDLLNGGTGNDVLYAGAGDDIMYGEAGDDRLIGQSGANVMYGDAGADILLGGRDGDTMYGGADNDKVFGGGGDDVMYGDAGDDILNGGGGNDTLSGGAGTDTLMGGGGTDTADYSAAAGAVTANLATGSASNDGNGGSDLLYTIENLTGSAFNDDLTGNSGDNVLTGGDGNDTLTGRGGADTIDGGNGTDTASYVNAVSGVTASLLAGSASDDGNGSSDTFTSIENLNGSGYDDNLTGDTGANTISGNNGDDTMDGDAGNDTLYGGAGSDTISGGDNDDTIYALDNGVSPSTTDDAEQNVLNGGNGNDTLYGSGGTDTLNGDAGDDVLYSGASVSFTVANAMAERPAVTYSAATGNFYEYVNSSVNYTTADSAATSTTLNGVAGHLATITSATENSYVQGIIGNSVWLGGTDAAVEGDWYWVTGPESGIEFWTGGPSGGGGAAVGGMYENWQNNQPNDWGGNQDNMVMATNGSWADFTDTSNYRYVIEWEGSDVLTGQITTLNGGAGNDTIYGNNGGEDYFSYEDGTTFGYVDTIYNFNTSDNDAIDLYPLLNSYYDSSVDIVTDFVQIVTNGANSELYVDITGTATFGAAQHIATIVGVTGLTNEAALVSAGNLIVPTIQLDIIGTPAPDTLSDTPGAFNHRIGGLASDDLIYGGAGNDTLYGMAGNDTANYANAAGAVTASLAAGGTGVGQDGDGGTDTYNSIENLAGSAFNDSLTGDTGDNILTGNGGNDTLDGGAGSDTAAYINATGAVTANLATGTSSGPDGVDTYISIENLTGSNYNDTLIGDGNNNVLSGGSGDDTLIGAGGNDTLDGGAGTDTADYSSAAAGITVDLSAGTASDDGDGGSDTLTSIENVIGSNSSDSITGDSNDNVLTGGAGNDSLLGGAGDDTLNGDAGVGATTQGWDYYYYDIGSALNTLASAGFTLSGGIDNTNTVTSNGVTQNLDPGTFNTGDYFALHFQTTLTITTAGTYTFETTSDDGSALFLDGVQIVNNDGLHGSATVASAGQALAAGTYTLDATFFENTGAQVMDVLMSGPDTGGGYTALDTYSGVNVLIGGDDTLYGGAGNDTLNGGLGSDTAAYTYAAGAVTASLAAGTASDGDGGTDTFNSIENLLGSYYNDSLTGDTNANVISGGVGSDTINGGDGADTLYALDNGISSMTADDSYANTLNGGNGNDTIYGSGGTDTLNGDAGNDILYSGSHNAFSVAYIESTYGVTYDAGTGNYYQYVGTGVTYSAADSAATSSLIEGVAGHLATITSSAENTFITGLIGGNAWLGGSDSVTEGDWYWVTGPDSGTEFWTGGPSGGGGAAVGGMYENWQNNQPNDWGGNQDNMVINSGTGQWADWVDTSNYGYVIEWEGSSLTGTSNTSTLNGGTGDDTLYGGSGTDILNGNADNDTIYGGIGDDTINGGTGNDILYALDNGVSGANADDGYANIVNGDDGTDTIYGSTGTDTLNGGNGNDIIYSGSGVGFTVADALAENPSASYDATTGNFYQVVTSNVNWATASAGAAGSTINSVAGHLATITSGAENTFITGLLSGTDAWVGARDDVYSTNDEWYWVEGPEAGTQFSTGAPPTAVGGMYMNWSGTEPNNDGGPSEAMRIQTSGQWADRAASTNYNYVIEWEGSDVLGGGGNVSILNGGSGADQLYGNAGEDWFVFDYNSGDAFANPDTINNFDETDNDTLNISDILDMTVGAGVVNAGNLSQYVNVDSTNGVQIDTTGTGTFGASTTIASFAGTTTVTDENTLLTNGQLVI